MPKRFFVFCTAAWCRCSPPRCCLSPSGTQPDALRARGVLDDLRLDLSLDPVRQRADGDADDAPAGAEAATDVPRRLIRPQSARRSMRFDTTDPRAPERDRHHRREGRDDPVQPAGVTWSRLVTPTRPSAPGTRSQNAGMKLTRAAGPRGCCATSAVTAPRRAPRRTPRARHRGRRADHLGGVGQVQHQQHPHPSPWHAPVQRDAGAERPPRSTAPPDRAPRGSSVKSNSGTPAIAPR